MGRLRCISVTALQLAAGAPQRKPPGDVQLHTHTPALRQHSSVLLARCCRQHRSDRWRGDIQRHAPASGARRGADAEPQGGGQREVTGRTL
jgi:hypothetical protein